MQEFIERIRTALIAQGVPRDIVRVESPRDPSLGDFAFPCFPLAKIRRTAPPAIASELAQALGAELQGIAVEATGPYLNFRVDRGELARSILSTIREQGARYGGSDEGGGRVVLIDFSSPNIAKPMHVGHLRSTIIGAALQRIHDLLGYRTVGINHVGDWGSQFGKLVVALQRWGHTIDLETDPIRALLALYVRFHEEVERDASLDDAARAAFRELESGEEGEVRATWRRLTELSLAEFQKIYDRLNVRFDFVRGEAYYESHLDATVERIVGAGVTEESDGALIVDLSSIKKNMAPCLLRKTDGTTLYATRDLAALFLRWDEFHFERALYVVGSEQRLHFRQLKGVLKRMELDWEERVEHVDFGLLKLPEGKLSTRKGKVVFLNDLLDRAVREARRIIDEKNPELSDPQQVAEQVGLGAVVFHDLKKERVKDVVFDWKEVLSFEGETGPYVQYTHARLASILRKADATPSSSPDWGLLEDAAELLLMLGRFPGVVRAAASSAEPSLLSQFLLELCRATNAWYVGHRVISDDTRLQEARLALVDGAKTVLASGLALLGVSAPQEM